MQSKAKRKDSFALQSQRARGRFLHTARYTTARLPDFPRCHHLLAHPSVAFMEVHLDGRTWQDLPVAMLLFDALRLLGLATFETSPRVRQVGKAEKAGEARTQVPAGCPDEPAGHRRGSTALWGCEQLYGSRATGA